MPRTNPDILMLIPNLDLGGAQKVFHDHSLLLAERYKVEEAVFSLEHGHAFPTGHPVHELRVGGGGWWPAKALNLYRRVRAARKLKERLRPRLCISHMPGADYVNLLSRRGEKTVAVVHGSKRGDRNMMGALGRLQTKLMLPFLYRHADRVITVSRDLADEIAELGVDRSKVRVINNFFPLDRLRSAASKPLEPAEEALLSGASILVTAGRLVEEKNHLALLEVVAGLRARRPVRLLILGDGHMREALTKRAGEHSLPFWSSWSGEPLTPGRDVYFLGMQDNPYRWFARADLFLLTSKREGFPMALGEAMACGLAVASTDCWTGPREILSPASATPTKPHDHEEEGHGGLLLPLLHSATGADRDLKVWVDSLDRLLGDRERLRRLSVAARTRMEAFSRERIGQQWFELLEELIG
jgi:glycosyltransferase involved in cell wall biosynthesis